ncbi:MAG: uroporphyrinogen decarboxylase family protein [Clostridiales bacterium]|nr:uroporphyrinogen decarboxylase family protein [Clostridiales bacterium]
MNESIEIPKDEMTPKERMIAFSNGLPIDRVPCCPFNGESFANYFGYGLNDFNHNTDIIVDTVIKTFDRFKTDNCSIGPGLHGMPEAMGCELNFFKSHIPQIKETPFREYNDLSWLKEVNPYKDGRLNLYLEALKRIYDQVGEEVNVGSTVGAPFTTAGLIIGVDRFMRDLVKNKEGVKAIIEVAYKNTLSMIDALLEIGISPGMADPLASSHLISKKMYDEFVLPYTEKCQSYIKARTGGGSVLHICGKTKPIWSSMIKTGIAGISLDNCDDIGELTERHGKEVMVIGNVDPVNTILMGQQVSIYQAVKECCEKGMAAEKGFVLATGCDVPIGTKPENIDHFMNAARVYGNKR